MTGGWFTTSGRRLRPFADTAGLDLDILAVDSCVSTAVQVKGEFVGRPNATLSVQVPQNTFRARSDRYIVFAPYEPRRLRLAPYVWVLREDVFAKLAGRARGWLTLQGSLKEGSRDRWAPYRYRPGELAQLFEGVIAVCAVGRVKELPDTRRR